MKRLMIAVLLVGIFASKASAQAPVSDQQRETNSQIAGKILDSGHQAYWFPGAYPVVQKREVQCAFPQAKRLGQNEWLALINAQFDAKCTTKGLVPISRRLEQRFYLLWGADDRTAWNQVKQFLADGKFDYVSYDPMSDGEVKRAMGIPMVSGYNGSGSKTRLPAVPVDHTTHAMLLQAIRPTMGTYAADQKGDVRVALFTGVTLSNSKEDETCMNMSGERVFAAVLDTPFVPTTPTPIVDSAIRTADTVQPISPTPERVVERKRRGGPCGPIAIYCWGPPLAVAAILANRGQQQQQQQQINIIVPGQTPEVLVPTEAVKNPGQVPLPPRPQGLRFSF
jgi:hypothetical protein